MNSLLARRNLRFVFIGILLLVLLFIPFFLVSLNDSKVWDRLPFVGYTETHLLYDQDGKLITATKIREIGSESTLEGLRKCAESQGREEIDPKITEALLAGAHTAEVTWECP